MATSPRLSQRRWYNPRLPQTLVISQWLLYFNAFWAALGILSVGLNPNLQLTALGRIFSFGALATSLYGAYGIANEKKIGYRVAVVSAFLPFVVAIVSGGSIVDILLPGGILNAIFVWALVALLLHTQSREHQRIWFS